ncbi:MAG TPA: TIGR04283 family arsenosugar biosynthesis glycosyltransferase [Blastocatellia bacterium]|nr:TIGR04283 family arsenosugar biosynthesis glycosyltransferase [Blastocatellia bacterium]
MISIIIPTLNEAATICATAAAVRQSNGKAEIIVSDGGSTDGTVEKARECGLRTISAPRGRGPQMNAAAQIASGDVLLFLHADTRLPAGALQLIIEAMKDSDVCGGNFSLIFDGRDWGSRLLTRLYPLLRLGGMCYGDSGFFVRRAAFEAVGGFRNFPIFEDCDLYKRLRRLGRFVHLKQQAVTSSRRFEGKFLRTFALWSALQLLYWLGVNPHHLNRLYRPAR